MIKKIIALTAAGMVLSASAIAQTPDIEKDIFQKNNWFVTGGINTEAFMNTDGYITAVGKLGAGIWVNPWLGLKLEGVAGNTHLLEDSRGQVFGAHLTYMTHLYGGKKYRPFNLNAVLGMGFYHHKFGTILKEYSKMNILTGNLGIQAVYNITPKWSVYLEPGMLLQPKYYDVNHKKDVMLSGYLSAGVTYNFSNLFSQWHKRPEGVSRREYKNSLEIKALNDKINAMQLQILGLNTKLEKTQEAQQPTTEQPAMVQEPMRDIPTVDINFDAMGSFLSSAELEKLHDIGTWLQDHPKNSISIVPFADSMAGAKMETGLKLSRVKAITKVLTEKYGIDSKRIRTANAEELGYVNKTGAVAMIVFMAE